MTLPEVDKPEDDSTLFILIDGERIPAYQDRQLGTLLPTWPRCHACTKYHPVGSCPLKVAGVELCPLCHLPHYGFARVCPHIKSETMVRLMLDTLKNSSEPKYLVDAAVKYLRGVKGHLVHAKKKIRDAEEAAKLGFGHPPANGHAGQTPIQGQPPFQHRPTTPAQHQPPNWAAVIHTGFTPINSGTSTQHRQGLSTLDSPLRLPLQPHQLSPAEEDVEERLLAAFQQER